MTSWIILAVLDVFLLGAVLVRFGVTFQEGILSQAALVLLALTRHWVESHFPGFAGGMVRKAISIRAIKAKLACNSLTYDDSDRLLTTWYVEISVPDAFWDKMTIVDVPEVRAYVLFVTPTGAKQYQSEYLDLDSREAIFGCGTRHRILVANSLRGTNFKAPISDDIVPDDCTITVQLWTRKTLLVSFMFSDAIQDKIWRQQVLPHAIISIS